MIPLYTKHYSTTSPLLKRSCLDTPFPEEIEPGVAGVVRLFFSMLYRYLRSFFSILQHLAFFLLFGSISLAVA
jgi:hypothetical protein